MFGIGPMELVLILVVALLVLGPKRMPELARTIGRGLGEFRRASNDLRQSLALDDLKNDLRQGLTDANTIKKPDQDRPAQAGDDLAPGTDDANATGSQDDPADGGGESNAADAADTPDNTPGNTLDNNPAVTRTHPGELPPDHDPHAHHDVDEEPATRPTATPADSQLGNVPVGGAPAGGPTSTATPTSPKPPSPPASPTPSTSPGRTDDERG
jgi:Tat protein translocase TatB subunit